MGRRKIEIQPLSDDRNRTVTFVKRKAGLFKKAHELAVLCQVDLSVIIVGNNNKIYEYSTVDTKEIFNCYEKTLKTRKHVHEEKSPENYSIYRKKRHLHEPLTNKQGQVVGTSAHLNDEDVDQDMLGEDEYDEEDGDDEMYDTSEGETSARKRPRTRPGKTTTATTTYNKSRNPKVFNSKKSPPPPPPTQISLNNVPPFNKYKKPSITVSTHSQKSPASRSQQNTPSPNMSRKEGSRPVLRVQIPTDAKGNQTRSGTFNLDIKESGSTDTARTITAVENTSSSINQSSSTHTGVSGSTNSSHQGIGHTQNAVHLGDGDVLHNNNSANRYGAANHLMRNQTPSSKLSAYSSFRSPDSRKPTLPLPINSKSQTSSPASATYPGLPNPLSHSGVGSGNSRSSSGGSNMNPSQFGDVSTVGDRQPATSGNNNTSNTAINTDSNNSNNNNIFSPSVMNLNSGGFFSMNPGSANNPYMNYSMQGFNQQFSQYNQNNPNQQTPQSSNPQAFPQRSQLQSLPQSSAIPQSAVANSESSGQLPSAQPPDSANKFRPSAPFAQPNQPNQQLSSQQLQQLQQLHQLQQQPQQPQNFGNNSTNNFNGEQTPVSALPSRYMNDIFPFPSPSNFLAPQDWSTGMTPTTTQAPQFLMNVLPVNSGGGFNSQQQQQQQQPRQPQPQPQQPQPQQPQPEPQPQQEKASYNDNKDRPAPGANTEQSQSRAGFSTARDAAFGTIAEEDENASASGNPSSSAPTNADEGSKAASHITTEATSTSDA